MVNLERTCPSVVGKLQAISRSRGNQNLAEVHPPPNAVQFGPDLEGREQLIAPFGRDNDPGRCSLVATGMGGQPRHQTRHVIRVTVGEEHSALLREQGGTSSHIHRRPVNRDDECRGDCGDGRADELESVARETEFAGIRVHRFRKIHPGFGRHGSTVTSVEARISIGFELTYLTSKVPGLKGAASERGLPAIV